MQRLRNRVALVTGGAGGIGSAIARRLADEGATVLIADINEEGARRVATEIGGETSSLWFDAYDHQSIEAMVQHVGERHACLDILVNNVADTSLTASDGNVLETSVETFDRSIASNLRSIFIATKAALPLLLAAKGAIVNISSGSALAGDSWLTAYASAKAALISLTRNTAVQFGKQGVRCNSVCPGFIAHGRAREMMPETLESVLAAYYTTRNGEPEDIAALVAFLASDEAGFINGENVVCDGAHSVGATPWRSGVVNSI